MPVTATILCFYQAQVKQIRDRVQAEQRRKAFRLLNLFEKERVRVVPIDRVSAGLKWGKNADLKMRLGFAECGCKKGG